MLSLDDPSLLRNQLYIDGDWVDADSGATLGDILGAALANREQDEDDSSK